MARKRMLSPDIWESQSFSSLSDLSKIVFIGLISLADDDGRGKANPAFIKSTLFPYDENRRVAEVKSALSQIARCTSTQFYSVNGNDYYFLKNWTEWQKIDKPSKSKLPPPPSATDSGVGALLPESEKNTKFDEHSTNTRRILDEASSTKENRIEENRIEKKREMRACAPACEGQALVSHKEIKSILPFIIIDENYKPKRTLQEYMQAKSRIEKSDFAKTVFKRLRDIDNHFDDIVADKYKNFVRSSEPTQKVEKTYTSEQLNAMFDNLSYDDA